MVSIFFYGFAAIAVVSALLMLAFRNPVHSALALVTTILCVAGTYVLLEAYFLAAVQVIAYAGAVMVLFLFVIMLLNLGEQKSLEPNVGRYRRVSVVLLAGLLLAQLAFAALRRVARPAPFPAELTEDNVAHIGRILYTEYLLPFEVASFVLLVALIGVVVLVERGSTEPSGS